MLTLVVFLNFFFEVWPSESTIWVSYRNFNYIRAVVQGPQDIYAGTTQGLIRYNFRTRVWEEPYTTSNGLHENQVEGLYYDEQEMILWIKTPTGLERYHPYFNDFESVPISHLNPALFFSQKNLPAIPLYMNDNFSYMPEDGVIRDNYSRIFRISDFMADRFSNIWVGTWGDGLYQGSLHMQKLEKMPYSLIESNVAAMGFDGENIWFGGVNQSAGITRFNHKKKLWTHYSSQFTAGLTDNNVTSICVTPDFIWFGTWGGLLRFEKKNEQWKHFTELPHNNITVLTQDDSLLWIGTVRGMGMLNMQQGSFNSAKFLENREILDIQVKDTLIWVASQEGLCIFHKTRRRWQILGDIPILKDRICSSLFLDHDRIWIGTQVGLFFLRLEDHTWAQVPMAKPFEDAPIYGIDGDINRLWIALDEGVLCYLKKKGQWKYYRQEDGLIDNKVQSIAVDGEYVWFGTPTGVTRFWWERGE